MGLDSTTRDMGKKGKIMWKWSKGDSFCEGMILMISINLIEIKMLKYFVLSHLLLQTSLQTLLSFCLYRWGKWVLQLLFFYKWHQTAIFFFLCSWILWIRNSDRAGLSLLQNLWCLGWKIWRQGLPSSEGSPPYKSISQCWLSDAEGLCDICTWVSLHSPRA